MNAPIKYASSVFHGSFLRSAQIFAQNCAIRRNVAQIHSPRFHSEKQAAQHREKLRKNSLGNYESPALTAELQALRRPYSCVRPSNPAIVSSSLAAETGFFK
jgi:hypothetical protein